MASVPQLLTATRQLANIENNAFCTDHELTGRLNDGKQDLYDLIVETADGAYLKTSTTFTLAGGFGGNVITLPSDFYRLKGVDRNPGSTPVERVAPVGSFVERNYPNRRGWLMTGSATLEIRRPEIAGGTYQLWYWPLLVPFWNPTLTLLATDNVVASSKTWTFGDYTFDSTFVGQTLTIAGASNGGNNGTFTITSAAGSTLTASGAGGLVNETFASTVIATITPTGVETTTDTIMTPFALYLQLHAARTVAGKREMMDLAADLGGRFAAQEARVRTAVRSRREEPMQVGRAPRYGWWWNGGGGDCY